MSQEDKEDKEQLVAQLRTMRHESAFIYRHNPGLYLRNICVEKIGGKYNQAENVWSKPDGSLVQIYGRDLLTHSNINRLQGRYYRQIVVDHAIVDLSVEEQVCFTKASAQIRVDEYSSKPPVPIKHPLVDQAIPMHIYCPMCHTQHIDEGVWVTKPHHTHSCQTCGHTWRPAVVCTVGVQFLPGFKNKPPAPRKIEPVGAPFHKFHIVQAMRDADVLGCVPVVSDWHCGAIMEAVEAMYPATNGFRDLVKKEMPF